MNPKKTLSFVILFCSVAACVFVAYAQMSNGLFLTQYQWIPFHDPESPMYIENCTACHGERTNEVSLDPNIKKAHSTMTFLGTGSDRCKICHGAPDFINQSAVGIRQNVDKISCSASSCHGRSGPLPFYAVNSDETAVHDWAIFELCPVTGSQGRNKE